MRALKIRQKVLLTMLGVGIPSLVMLSFLVINSAEIILQESVARQVSDLATKSTQSLEDLVVKSKKSVKAISESPDVHAVVSSLEGGNKNEIAAALARLDKSFLDFHKMDSTIQAIRFIDADGNVLVKIKEGHIVPRNGPFLKPLGLSRIHSVKKRYFFQNAMTMPAGSILISNLERGRVEEEELWCPAMVRFAMPLFFSDGRRAGVVIINVWGKSAGDMMNRLISSSQGVAFLIERNPGDQDRHGIYLFHKDDQCVFGNQTGTNIKVFKDFPQTITDQWMSKDEGVIIHPDSQDILAHKFYSPYGRSDQGWVVVVNAKQSFFMAPLAAMKKNFLILAGIVLVIMAIAASFFARSLTKPIQAVIEGTHQISEDLGTRIEVESKDEIGHLADEINLMAATLQQNLEEKRRVEEKIAQAEKLASIGEMAAGLAHELNTPLGNIHALSSLARKECDAGRLDPTSIKSDLKDISEQTARCSNIISGLLSFARRQNPELAPHQLNDLITDSLSLVRMRSDKKGVMIHFMPNDETPRVTVDGNQLRQVFVNLLLNALDAIKQGGTVAVDCFVSGETLITRIIDDGCGIHRDHLGKIFDPFFTTKEVGEGTGLGLSVSYGIVKNLGGTIEVVSTPGKGSVFSVILPLKEHHHD